MTKLLSLILTTVVLVTPTAGQDRTAAIDKIFSWTSPSAPGCVVAVSQHGKTVVNRAYGVADLERAVPITTETVFDAGSVTKQFVAAAVLTLVEDGNLSLSENVRKYLPELPDPGHTITLDHLLTHTSGTRDWTGIRMLADGDDDALTLAFRQRGLNFPPGEEWAYSNSGYVLLKEIVARAAGKPFSDFTRARFFEPLAMKSTQYLLDMRAVVENRALAYQKNGDSWKIAVLLDNDRGGGGALLTTAADLLIWNDALTNGRLGAFVTTKLHERATLNNGRKLGYARGLFLDVYRGAQEIEHSGSADGYKTCLTRYPEHDLSIAIMSNAGDDADIREWTRRIFDLFVPAAPPREQESGPPPNVADDMLADVNSKVGLFVNDETGQTIRLVVDRSRFRVANGPGLVVVTKDRVRRWGASLQFMSQDEFELNFLSSNEFELTSMEGKKTRYRRAESYAPTEADLKSFEGRYQNDEIGAVLEMARIDDDLVLRIHRSQVREVELKPADRDTFQISRMTIRFRRDEAGHVNALDLNNPVLRNIQFTRQSQ